VKVNVRSFETSAVTREERREAARLDKMLEIRSLAGPISGVRLCTWNLVTCVET